MRYRISTLTLFALVSAKSLNADARSISKLSVLDSFYPRIQDGIRLWLSADLLYFLPDEKSIVLTNEETNLFTTNNVTEEAIVDPHFKWDFGYRIGFGYIFSSRKWDMAINWMHFNTHAQQSRSSHGDIGLGMFPIWSLDNDILPYDWVAEAKMYWKLNVNLIDLDFGRAFSWRRAFFVRPFLGLRAAWVDQHMDVDYGGGIFANGLDLAALDSTFGFDTINMRNDFFGIGTQLGVEPQVNLGKGWRIYGSACGTLCYGFFDVHQRETYLTTIRYNKHRHPHDVRWVLDATGGVMWKTFLSRERFALTFKLGWEYHLFFDQVEFKGDEFGLVSDDRNLILNGVSLSARFDF